MKKYLIVIILFSTVFVAFGKKNIMLVKLEGNTPIVNEFNQLMIESKVFAGAPLTKPNFRSVTQPSKIANLIQAAKSGNLHYILEPVLDVDTYSSFNILKIKIHQIGEKTLTEIQPKYFKHVSKKGPRSVLSVSKWLHEILEEVDYLLRTSSFKTYAAFFTEIEGDQAINEINKQRFREQIGRKINQDLLSKDVFIEYINDDELIGDYQITIFNRLEISCDGRECHSVIANISMEGGQARDCDHPLNIYQRSEDDIAKYLAELEKIYSELNIQ